MELDVTALERELQEIDQASTQVSARLDASRSHGRGGRGRMAAGGPGMRAQPPHVARKAVMRDDGRGDDITGRGDGPGFDCVTGQGNGESGLTSRRYMNRDWHTARLRTAQGRFADDQTMATDVGADDGQGPQPHPPHNDHRSGQRVSSGSVRATISRSGRLQSVVEVPNPSRISHNAAVRSASMRSSEPERGRMIADAPALPSRNTAMRPGLAERLTRDGHPKAQAGSDMQEAQVMQEEYVVEKRPATRQCDEDPREVKRHKRMMGSLLGHLHGFKRQVSQFEKSETALKRKELEKNATKRIREEEVRIRLAARQQQIEERRQAFAEKRELTLLQHMKVAELMCAKKIAFERQLLTYLRTQTAPRIMWKPAVPCEESNRLYEAQLSRFGDWIVQAQNDLEEEKAQMRAKSERRWAAMDAAHAARQPNQGNNATDSLRTRVEWPSKSSEEGALPDNAIPSTSDQRRPRLLSVIEVASGVDDSAVTTKQGKDADVSFVHGDDLAADAKATQNEDLETEPEVMEEFYQEDFEDEDLS